MKTPTNRVQILTELHQMRFDSRLILCELLDKGDFIFNKFKATGSIVHVSLNYSTVFTIFNK